MLPVQSNLIIRPGGCYIEEILTDMTLVHVNGGDKYIGKTEIYDKIVEVDYTYYIFCRSSILLNALIHDTYLYNVKLNQSYVP